MTVELPKDAKGREIPLDTRVLYNEDAYPCEIAEIIYNQRCFVPDMKWEVIFVNGSQRYASEMFLKQPEPQDTWDKLKDDLRRAERHEDTASCCRYFTTDKCADCRIKGYASECIYIEERAFGDILDRICKLRGED